MGLTQRTYLGATLALMVACSRTPPPAPGAIPKPQGPIEAKKPDDSKPQGEGAMRCVPDQCNDLALFGEALPVVATAEPPPPQTGGGIPPNRYRMIDSHQYTGAGGANGPIGELERMTLDIRPGPNGNVLQVVATHPDCPINRETRTLEFDGAHVTSARICPPCQGGVKGCDVHVYSYSWDGKQLSVLAPFPEGATQQRRLFLPAP